MGQTKLRQACLQVACLAQARQQDVLLADPPVAQRLHLCERARHFRSGKLYEPRGALGIRAGLELGGPVVCCMHAGESRDDRERVAALFRALDPHWTIHDVISEGDMVVVRWSHTGRHVGEFLGVAPTGRSFVLRGIDMYRVQDGKMAEHWNVVDLLAFYQQIGLLPTAAR